MVENWLASHVSSVIQLKLKTVGETGTCSYIFYPSLYLGFSVRKLEDVEGRGEEGEGGEGRGGGCRRTEWGPLVSPHPWVEYENIL